MSSQRRLSILIPVLRFGRAGGYRVLSKLADEWIGHGCRVAFLAPCWSGAPFYPTRAEVHWVDGRGREVEHRSGAERTSSMVGRAWRLFNRLRGLKQGIGRVAGPWDIVLANHSMTAWPVALTRSPGAKVYYVQAYEPEFFESLPGLNSFIEGSLSWASYFLPLHRIVNAPVYLRYRSLRARSWIPPGIDLGVFHSGASENVGEEEPSRAGLTVGCIGRVERDKGTPQAIEAYREFVKRAPGRHRFRLASFGVPPEWLEGVPGLECVTPSSDDELADYYRSIDALLALATKQHGAHHYPVLEAMATGVSVVTTGYAPADPSNAWVVGSDPLEAAVALQEIFADPVSAGAKSRLAEAAIQAYAWPKVGERFLDELRSLA